VSVEQFEQVLDVAAGRPEVRISFDDGNASDLELALPRLLERGLTACFFLLAGRLGEPGRLHHDGVRELVSSGMTIGSHGWAHRDWRRMSDAEARMEIAESLRTLSRLASRPVATVAVPFGSYDRRVLSRLRRASVDRVFTSDGGRARADSWLQSRTSLSRDLDQEWIRSVTAQPAIGTRIRRSGVRCLKRLRG
jgi:peptidoglycan/xylan/chitin deacetylase (PgdA/CDA1 family)